MSFSDLNRSSLDFGTLNVVLTIHKASQFSAQTLLELLMSFEEGIATRYYLYYGEPESTLKIQETIAKFLATKSATLSFNLPAASGLIESIPASFQQVASSQTHPLDDHKQLNDTLRSNLSIFNYIHQLDHFLAIEPDCIVLQHHWAKSVYDAFLCRKQPIVGHVRQEKIGDRWMSTHFSKCAVYDCLALRTLPLESCFYQPFGNPWQKLCQQWVSPPANPVLSEELFSGCYTPYPYLLFALYFQHVTGSSNPSDWPSNCLESRTDIMSCDESNRLTIEGLLAKYYEKLPLFYGVEDDAVRQVVLRTIRSKGLADQQLFPLGGKFEAEAIELQRPVSQPSEARSRPRVLRPDNSSPLSIAGLRGQFTGNRCFIIGNGPSLNQTDLSRLKHEYTFGLNRIYLNYARMGFEPTFYCCVNPNVTDQFADEIDQLNSIKFVTDRASGVLKNHWNTFFMKSLAGLGFNENLNTTEWYEGWTVTYCAMQVAFHLGFQEVILVGVDHYFKDSGEPNQAVAATGPDINHFHPDYFSKGVIWQYPDLDHSEQSYRIAKAVYERNNRRILDATIGGHLQVFEKVDYDRITTVRNLSSNMPNFGKSFYAQSVDLQVGVQTVSASSEVNPNRLSLERSNSNHLNVVLNFHKVDQFSARILLELLMSLEEGIETFYHLQYGDPESTLEIQETLFKFLATKKATLSTSLPNISVPREMVVNDPNLGFFSGNHSRKNKIQKEKILQWNLAVFKHIQQLDHFLMMEPDCVVLKHNWAKPIHDAFLDRNQPFVGHLKRGKIAGRLVPTHFAGCTVYDGLTLRKLPLEKYFYERYDNPWWPLRDLEGTTTANNAFWGPAYSGYDIAYDLFLFALYLRELTGSNNPLDWPTDCFESREDLIFCDFRSQLTVNEIMERYYGKLSMLHGVKDDAGRLAVLRAVRSKGLADQQIFPIGGRLQSPAIDRQRPLNDPPEEYRSFGLLRPDNSGLLSIADLRGQFAGKRCFIIGNGPSLNKTNLSRLKDEYTFGLNRIYLNYAAMGFEPTFYCCVNPNVINQFAEEIDRLNSVKFLTDKATNVLKNHWNTFFFNSILNIGFNEDLNNLRWYEGWTVTYCAMQVAFHLGFQEVILVGVDHYFKDSGEPNKAVTATGADANHFHPDYFGKGVVWQYPDLERSEQSYTIAKEVYERHDRCIFDATVGGHLQVFPKVDYDYVTLRHKGLLHRGGLIGKNMLSSIASAAPCQVVSLNPDVVDEVGHYLTYEDFLHETFQQVDVPFLSICNRSMDPLLLKTRPHAKALLTTHTWELGNYKNTGAEPPQAAKESFRRDVLALVESLTQENPDTEFIFYMYCGSLYHAEQLLDIMQPYPHLRAVVTLFWLAFTNIWADGFQERWQTLLQQCRDEERITLTVTTSEQQDELYRRTGYALPVLPHPSTTIDDSTFFQLKTQPPVAFTQPPQQYSILFPGNPLKEKGCELTIEAVRLLAEKARELPTRCLVRIPKPEKLSAEMQGAMAEIDPYAEVLSGGLDRLAFIQLIRESHVIVLPYFPPTFAQRTSGLLIDAIYCGIPVVVLSGTWLGNLVARTHCGVVVEDFTGQAIVEAIEEIIANYPLFQAAALQASSEFFQTNNWTSLAAAIIGSSSVPFTQASPLAGAKNLVGGFGRQYQAHIDETQIVAQLMSAESADSVMIDVGAHQGFALSPFMHRGWRIFAYEPDPDNRRVLVEKVKEINSPINGHSSVTIDQRAVSDQAGDTVTLYASEESTGISTLTPFRDSHTQKCQVVTTTVAQICAEYNLEKIDFLKIDTEGYDLMVLKGVPWDKIRPRVIECEFEDRKTVPLGYTFHDLAQYLVDRGYTVLVSEWHPVIRYGIQHDWHRLVTYPCQLSDCEAWGNILAFREPPDLHQVSNLAQKLVTFRSSAELSPVVSVVEQAQPISPSPLASIAVEGRNGMNSTRSVASQPSLTHEPHAQLNGKKAPPSQEQTQPTTLVSTDSSPRLTSSVLSRIARYYSRWPLGVAVLAVTLNTVAMMDNVPYRWAFSGGGSLLMLFLVGHAASKADFALGVGDRAQSTADRVNESVNRAHKKATSAFKRATNANQSVRRTAEQLSTASMNVSTALEASDRARSTAEFSLQRSNQATNSAKSSLETANRALGNSEFSLEIAKRAQEKANSSLEMAEQALGQSDAALNKSTQASDQVKSTVETVTHTAQVVSSLQVQISKTNSVNAGLFQSFDRQLSNENLETFMNFWLPTLNLTLDRRALGYLAHRICLSEDTCSGRLATTVQDMLLRILVARSIKSRDLSVLEIGSLFGINLAILYETCRDFFENIHLSAIDPLDGYYDKGKTDLITQVPVTRSTFEHNMRQMDIPGEAITLIQGLSTDDKVLEQAGQKQYNVLIIDGDHSYDGVKFDFDHYLAAVDVGGYIIFDDYSTDHWPDVADFVDREVKPNPCVELVGSSWRTAVFKVVRKHLG